MFTEPRVKGHIVMEKQQGRKSIGKKDRQDQYLMRSSAPMSLINHSDSRTVKTLSFAKTPGRDNSMYFLSDGYNLKAEDPVKVHDFSYTRAIQRATDSSLLYVLDEGSQESELRDPSTLPLYKPDKSINKSMRLSQSSQVN